MKRSRILPVILLALVLALVSATTACGSGPRDAAPYTEDSEQVSFKSTFTGRWYHAREFSLDGRRYLLVEGSAYGHFQVIPLD